MEFAGAIGDDAFGRRVLADFAGAGVGTRGVRLTDTPTCQVMAIVEPDGERSLVVWPPDGGALVDFRAADLDTGLIAGAVWLHVTGMCLRHEPVRSAVLAAMAAARAASIPVSIDLNLRVELWGLDAARRAVVEAAVALADVVLAQGDEELIPLTGAPDVASAARLLANGERTVVARLGAGGALAIAPYGVVLAAPAFAVIQVNPIGAGDAFNGGFIAARVEGRPLAEALRWGNAVGACKVASPGGARDLPDRTAMEAMLAHG